MNDVSSAGDIELPDKDSSAVAITHTIATEVVSPLDSVKIQKSSAWQVLKKMSGSIFSGQYSSVRVSQLDFSTGGTETSEHNPQHINV